MVYDQLHPSCCGKAEVAELLWVYALSIPSWFKMDWGLFTVRSTAEGSGTVLVCPASVYSQRESKLAAWASLIPREIV